MKARMKSNLVDEYQNCPEWVYAHGPSELEQAGMSHGKAEHQKIIDFLNSISGKKVDLVFNGGIAYEKSNSSFWLPRSLWSPI